MTIKKQLTPILLASLSVLVIVGLFILRGMNEHVKLIGPYVSLNLVMVYLEIRYIYRSHKNQREPSEGLETQDKFYNIMGIVIAILILLSPVLLIWL